MWVLIGQPAAKRLLDLTARHWLGGFKNRIRRATGNDSILFSVYVFDFHLSAAPSCAYISCLHPLWLTFILLPSLGISFHFHLYIYIRVCASTCISGSFECVLTSGFSDQIRHLSYASENACLSMIIRFRAPRFEEERRTRPAPYMHNAKVIAEQGRTVSVYIYTAPTTRTNTTHVTSTRLLAAIDFVWPSALVLGLRGRIKGAGGRAWKGIERQGRATKRHLPDLCFDTPKTVTIDGRTISRLPSLFI
jgi:hypothetical protein